MNRSIFLSFFASFAILQTGSADDHSVPKIIGCRIRTSALHAETLPDYIPVAKFLKGSLKLKTDEALMNSEIENNIKSDDSTYVLFCRCRLKGSSSVVLASILEVKASGTGYKPSFAYVYKRSISDLNQIHTDTVLKSPGLTVRAGTEKPELKEPDLKSNARISFASEFSGNTKVWSLNPTESHRNSSVDERAYVYLSWSNEGKNPDKELLVTPAGPVCEAF